MQDMKILSVFEKHKKAMDDLVQIGVLCPSYLRKLEVYKDRRVNKLTIRETAIKHRVTPRTICSDVKFLETDL